jgi:hypothetical protein
MKQLVVLTLITTTLLSASDCNKNKKAAMLKGRVEITGICLNYTIKLLEGDIDTSLIVADWTDENTGKSYTDVFGLSNPCTFPATLKQGDEFFFTIDTSAAVPCVKCEAWYPTPPRVLNIKVVEK